MRRVERKRSKMRLWNWMIIGFTCGSSQRIHGQFVIERNPEEGTHGFGFKQPQARNETLQRQRFAVFPYRGKPDGCSIPPGNIDTIRPSAASVGVMRIVTEKIDGAADFSQP